MNLTIHSEADLPPSAWCRISTRPERLNLRMTVCTKARTAKVFTALRDAGIVECPNTAADTWEGALLVLEHIVRMAHKGTPGERALALRLGQPLKANGGKK